MFERKTTEMKRHLVGLFTFPQTTVAAISNVKQSNENSIQKCMHKNRHFFEFTPEKLQNDAKWNLSYLRLRVSSQKISQYFYNFHCNCLSFKLERIAPHSYHYEYFLSNVIVWTSCNALVLVYASCEMCMRRTIPLTQIVCIGGCLHSFNLPHNEWKFICVVK